MSYPKKQNRHYLLPFIIVLFLFSIPSKAQKDSLVFYKSQFEKYKDLKQTELALDYIHKAQNSAHPKEQIELICEEGDLLIEMGLMNKAEQKLKSALELSKLLNKPSLEGYVYKELGYYYWISNNHPESYKCYLHCKDIYKKLADWDKCFENINNIGIYLEMEGNYAEARKHYEEAQQYFRKTQDTIGIISTSINICNIINAVDGPEKSLDCYLKLLKEKINNPIDLAQINFNIALNYFELEKFNEANIYIDQAISITEKIKNDNRLIDYYAWKAEIISKLKQYEKGNTYYWKSMKIAKKYDDLSFQIAIYESLIANHIKQKKLDSIEVWLVKANQLRDTLKLRETVVHHKQIKLDNELELNEQQLFKKSHQNKILLYLVFFGIIFTFLLIFSFYFYRKNVQKNLSLTKLKSIQLQNQNEINTLENNRIKDELKVQKREMLTSLVFLRSLNNDVQKVLVHLEVLMKKSVISKEDLLKLKEEIITRSENQTKKGNYSQKLTHTQKKFFTELLKMYPDLSNNELKILAYLRVGLNSKEIAEIQNVTIEAVRKTRYRVRKKLNLESDDSLEQFLIKFH